MQKQAPSVARILVAVGFTLSCFGLILFLWIAFGGPIPLKPESYRITAYFPEATQLAQESDVRIGGVSVGKVKSIELAPPEDRVNGNDTTEAVIEIEPEFAPISSDAKAILRQKTLLGETYVELTSGDEPDGHAAPVSLGSAANNSDATSQDVESIPEGGTLGISRTQDATEIDEIFNALDQQTRESFQRWMANSAVAVNGRGLDINDALGNLGPFVSDASDILSILRKQKVALKGLVRDTGTVFDALSERDGELAGVITGSNATFDALASEQDALAESFQIFPTFERESRLTLDRLDEFQRNTDPLVRDLIPVAHDLSPTLQSVRELSPHLKSLFQNLDPLITASKKGLPALAHFLNGLGPVLDELDPFLANLNPVLRYLRLQRASVVDFLVGPSAALSNSVSEPGSGDPAPRHYLRQLGYVSSETLSVWPHRLPTNRGNGYLQPGALNGFTSASSGIFPNFDCKNLDYPSDPVQPVTGAQEGSEEELKLGDPNTYGSSVNEGNPADAGFAPCVVAGGWQNVDPSLGNGRFPTLYPDP
jgi:phospholipid/cholesterol/gamma-HCH transport system substrate-binding protein